MRGDTSEGQLPGSDARITSDSDLHTQSTPDFATCTQSNSDLTSQNELEPACSTEVSSEMRDLPLDVREQQICDEQVPCGTADVVDGHTQSTQPLSSILSSGKQDDNVVGRSPDKEVGCDFSDQCVVLSYKLQCLQNKWLQLEATVAPPSAAGTHQNNLPLGVYILAYYK